MIAIFLLLVEMRVVSRFGSRVSRSSRQGDILCSSSHTTEKKLL